MASPGPPVLRGTSSSPPATSPQPLAGGLRPPSTNPRPAHHATPPRPNSSKPKTLDTPATSSAAATQQASTPITKAIVAPFGPGHITPLVALDPAEGPARGAMFKAVFPGLLIRELPGDDGPLVEPDLGRAGGEVPDRGVPALSGTRPESVGHQNEVGRDLLRRAIRPSPEIRGRPPTSAQKAFPLASTVFPKARPQ